MSKCTMRKTILFSVAFLSLVSLGLRTVPTAHALPKLKFQSCLEQKKPQERGPGIPQPVPLSGAMPTMAPTMLAESAAAPKDRSRTSAPKKEKKKNDWDKHQAGKKADKKLKQASEIYLSNDDSMSLASAQRIIYAIENFLPIYRNEIRPHEFLNYYHFETDPVVGAESFSVNFQITPQDAKKESPSSLAVAVQGKKVTKESRLPAVITLILDRSGSMSAQGKMAFLKEGLHMLKQQLKDGDVINVVEFDHETCTGLEGFVVGRDPWKPYDKTVSELKPSGSTNLHQGLTQGYQLASKLYDSEKLNRVILVTDAIANTGELSKDLMASITKYYDTKKIALSGIGVGLDFNDELLDTLTEAGKGAYLFLGIEQAIPRVFGQDFVSLLQTIARDVRFKLTLPESLKMQTFYGEEASEDPDKVQAIHYFANTSQLFLLDLEGKVNQPQNAKFSFTIDFENARTGLSEEENLSRSLAQVQANGTNNLTKAKLIMSFANLLEKTALPGWRRHGDWRSPPKLLSFDKTQGKKQCQDSLKTMNNLAKTYTDAETTQVMDLAKKYCARF